MCLCLWEVGGGGGFRVLFTTVVRGVVLCGVVQCSAVQCAVHVVRCGVV